jgi:hypothetical protein
VAKREISAHRQLEIARLNLYRALPAVEPILFLRDVDSAVGERRREAEDRSIRCVSSRDSRAVLVVVRLVARIEEGKDCRLIYRYGNA